MSSILNKIFAFCFVFFFSFCFYKISISKEMNLISPNISSDVHDRKDQNKGENLDNKLMKEFNKKVDVNSYKKIAIGKKLEALPGSETQQVGNKEVYIYRGNFFERSKDGYYISIVPPVGSSVKSLPENFKKVFIENNLVYSFDGIYYKFDSTSKKYVVIGDPLLYKTPNKPSGKNDKIIQDKKLKEVKKLKTDSLPKKIKKHKKPAPIVKAPDFNLPIYSVPKPDPMLSSSRYLNH